jgi:hypothetical protein
MRVMQGRVRAHLKTLNGQLKNWGILSQVFCHHISMQGNVFWACAMLTQFTAGMVSRFLRWSTRIRSYIK